MNEIYFAQIVGNGPIKIGITKKGAKNRVKKIDQSMPNCEPYHLKFLGSFPGDRLVEKSIHDKFLFCMIVNGNKKTEWFRPHPSLLQFIQQKTPVRPGLTGVGKANARKM